MAHGPPASGAPECCGSSAVGSGSCPVVFARDVSSVTTSGDAHIVSCASGVCDGLAVAGDADDDGEAPPCASAPWA